MADLSSDVQELTQKMWKKDYFVMFRAVVDASSIPGVKLQHFQWLIDLEKRNKVFASGPLYDNSGKQIVGMTVFRADTFEEAEELAAGDPFVTSGAVEFEVKRWQVNEGRINVSVDFSDQTFSVS
jgi:uncharacterized protein YciI